jgi:hypothetical protein
LNSQAGWLIDGWRVEAMYLKRCFPLEYVFAVK